MTFAPALTRGQQLDFYYWMRLTRTFDERMVALWKQGRGVGGTFSQRGHEAISVGAGCALGPDDIVAPMHRDLGTFLVRGITPRRIFANLLGRATGVTGGRDVNIHGVGDLSLGIFGFISHLPHSLPVGLGAAMSFRFTSTSPTFPARYRVFKSSTSSRFALNASWYMKTGLPSTLPGMSARTRAGSVYICITFLRTVSASSARSMALP